MKGVFTEGEILKTSIESNEESCEDSCAQTWSCRGWSYDTESKECSLLRSITQVFSEAVSGRICPGIYELTNKIITIMVFIIVETTTSTTTRSIDNQEILSPPCNNNEEENCIEQGKNNMTDGEFYIFIYAQENK